MQGGDRGRRYAEPDRIIDARGGGGQGERTAGVERERSGGELERTEAVPFAGEVVLRGVDGRAEDTTAGCRTSVVHMGRRASGALSRPGRKLKLAQMCGKMGHDIEFRRCH